MAPMPRGSGRSWGRLPHRLRHAAAGPLLMMALRACTLLCRFGLMVFVAKFLGLADLGFLSVVQALTVLAPAVLGFGLNGALYRQVVGMPWAAALPLMVTRLGFSVGIYVVLLPVALGLGFGLHPWLGAVLVLIVALEHLSSDAHGLLMSREWPRSAVAWLFVRGGLWPLAFMGAAWWWPDWRTLEALCVAWLLGLVVAWLGLLLVLTRQRAWWALGWQRGWLAAHVRKGWPLYLFDLAAVAQVGLDRLLVGAMLGLEAAGIYGFFWSLANGLHSLMQVGLLQQWTPQLVRALRVGPTALAACVRRQQLALWTYGALLAPLLGVAVAWLLPFVGRPELTAHMPLWWMILLATMMRLIADSWHAPVYAMHLDREIGRLALFGLGLGAVMLPLLVGAAGMMGAALAGGLTMAALTHWRLRTYAHELGRLAAQKPRRA